MRLTTAKQIVFDAEARGRVLDRSGSGWLDAEAAIYETALEAVRLVSADDDPQPAWERVAAMLSDTSRRLVIDALEITPIEQMRRRLRCIADMPEVTGFGSLQDVYALIGAAINVGAPRYNSGDVRGCASLYWITAQLIAEAPATRGIPGYARAIAQIKPMIEWEAPAGPFTPAAIDAFAWELRHALDALARVAS